MLYDFAIIGAGYGGVAVAALLNKLGFSTLILESHTEPGGCASFFKRKDFSFEVGATTISGFAPGKPIRLLTDYLGLTPEVDRQMTKLENGMVIYMNDKELVRASAQDEWLENVSKFFANQPQQRKFWRKIHQLDQESWKLLEINQRLMPETLSDCLDLIKPTKLAANISAVTMVPYFFKSMQSFMQDFALAQDQGFLNFVNEQLLITTQSLADRAPSLSGILGLAYPGEVYYPKVSIVNPLKIILENYKANSGDIFYKQEVLQIKKEQDCFELITDEAKASRSKALQNLFRAKKIISNIPIWNLAKILPEAYQNSLSPSLDRFKQAWGAFTVYLAVKTELDLKSLYYQIHTKFKIPYCNSESIFVSFSAADDLARAPRGSYALTISTHTDIANWENLSQAEYQERKAQAQDSILDNLYYYFPQIKHAEKLFVEAGTPKSFEFFTKRHRGYVGGIPHSVNTPLFTLPGQMKPGPGIYLVGDTSFPGQGVTAVIYSAISLVQKLTSSALAPTRY